MSRQSSEVEALALLAARRALQRAQAHRSGTAAVVLVAVDHEQELADELGGGLDADPGKSLYCGWPDAWDGDQVVVDLGGHKRGDLIKLSRLRGSANEISFGWHRSQVAEAPSTCALRVR